MPLDLVDRYFGRRNAAAVAEQPIPSDLRLMQAVVVRLKKPTGGTSP